MFARLNGIYTNQFTARFPTPSVLHAAVNEWAEELGQYSTHTVSEAVLVCRKHYPQPPNVVEFGGVCRTIHARERSLEAHAADERARALYRPKTQQEIETGKAALASLRKVVRYAR